MVCAYLIQECGMSVQQALIAFAAARPPGIKHEKFVVEVRPCFRCASSRPTQPLLSRTFFFFFKFM